MDEELSRRIRKARRAQAKRASSLLGGKKKCKIGKSCGATCIARHEICAVDLTDSLSEGLRRVSSGITSKVSGKESENKLSESLSKHLRENSFKLPGKSFSGGDIADLVNQAFTDLDGEAKENIDKMRKFILKDKTGFFVSEPKDTYLSKMGGPRNALEGVKGWALSKEFLGLLDRTLGVNVNEKFSEAVKDKENKITQLKDKIASLRKIIERVGEGAKAEKALLEQLTNTLSVFELDLKNLPLGLADYILGKSRSGGWTFSKARFVVIQEETTLIGHAPYDKSRGINARAMQKSIEETMDRRSKAKGNSAENVNAETFHFSSGFGRGRTKEDARNEQILLDFTHEMGHQLHYRSGQPGMPDGLSSMSPNRELRGITRYATTNSKELFAEAFVAYTFNPQALKSQDQKLYDWVDSYVNAALSNAGSPI